MDLTFIIGIVVFVFSVALVIALYFILRAVFARKASKEICIYVDERKEEVKGKVTNTPFIVEKKGRTRLSSDFVDDTVISKVRRVRT
jgi:hypothetical protein